MDIKQKILLTISYITILGWLIAFAMYIKGSRLQLTKYHLRQSFGLGLIFMFAFVLLLLSSISVFPILAISGYLFFVFFGVFYSIKLKRRPLPLIGILFINRFYFIG